MLSLAASRLASARAARAAASSLLARGSAAPAAAARPTPGARRPQQQPPPRRRSAMASAAASASASAAAAAAAAGGGAAASRTNDEKEEKTEETGPQQRQLVQYLVLRRDLWRDPALAWPLGPLVAQGAHAATAALAQALRAGCPHAEEYCSPANAPHMRKVVLEVEDERRLRAVAERLEAGGVRHWLWVEQPEGYATALATWPAPRSIVAPHVKKGKLCKAAVGAGGGGGGGGGDG